MNHAAMAGWIRYYDPYRLIQYEGQDPNALITDIRVPMYPGLEWIADVMADSSDLRPMIMCEYAYAKSNSNGNVYKFWKYVDKYPRFQGGFVWDWADKALSRQMDSGEKFWAYGGAFGEKVVDPVLDMCLNGVVFPDLEPKPGAEELKMVQAPIGISALDLGRGLLRVSNKYLALSLSHVEWYWTITEDGVVIQEGSIDQAELSKVQAGASGELRLSYQLSDGSPGKVYYLNLYCHQKEATPWSDAGHVIYRNQFELPVEIPFESVMAETESSSQEGVSAHGVHAGKGMDTGSLSSPAGVEVSKQDEVLRLHGETWQATFDMAKASWTSYQWKGQELFITGPVDNFFRAPTGIDEACGGDSSISEQWLKAGLHQLQRKVISVSHDPLQDGKYQIIAEFNLLGNGTSQWVKTQIRYTLAPNGQMMVEHQVQASKSLPILPRVGLTLTLPETMEQLEWLGRGPHENYADRKHSAHIGLYRSTVREQHVPYILPVECGGKEDVRWFTLKNANGYGVRIESEQPIHFDVHHHSVEDYVKARYAHDLPQRNETFVNIDHLHSGLGGDTGWTQNIHKEYRIYPGVFRYAFTICPLG